MSRQPAARGAKKKTTPSKEGVKQKKGEGKKYEYQYVELNKASLTAKPDSLNFYAVVIDATFPYKTSQDRYICSLKIVDSSLYIKGQKGTGDGSDYATLVLYAKRFEDLPIIHRIGDIIRVHRATLRLYNHQRQFNVNLFNFGAWSLFSTDKKSVLQEIGGQEAGNENTPFAFKGQSYHFLKHEIPILASIRKWAQQYFSQYNVISNDMFVPLNKVNAQKEDFDILAKITQIFEMDEYTNELRIRDSSNQSWNLLALKLKFPHLRQGDVIRVRSATYDETSVHKKVILLSHYSNIMTFVSSSKLAKEIKTKVSDEKVDKAALKQDVMMNSVVLTEVEKKYQSLPFHSLQDLFHNVDTDKEIAAQDTFRTQFYVTRIEPGDVKEWTKQYDKKTKKATSLKGSAASKSAGNIIYQL
jgi:hypothetical protein